MKSKGVHSDKPGVVGFLKQRGGRLRAVDITDDKRGIKSWKNASKGSRVNEVTNITRLRNGWALG